MKDELKVVCSSIRCARCGNEISDGNSYPIFSIRDDEVGEVFCHNCAKVLYNIYNPMNGSG